MPRARYCRFAPLVLSGTLLAMTEEYRLTFELFPLQQLDQFALLARQDYNLGNRGDWFGAFRGGLHAVYGRLHGADTHFQGVHQFFPMDQPSRQIESQLSSLLFNMDSALECLVFAANALGGAAEPTGFWDVASDKELRRIGPNDLLLDPGRPGYTRVFPNLRELWRSRAELIRDIMDQHDVSKHREVTWIGGVSADDAPKGYFEERGKDLTRSDLKTVNWRQLEILLRPEPKSRSSQPGRRIVLEDLAKEYEMLINQSALWMLVDGQRNIALPVPEFRR